MPTIALRFLAGRYHATPWGRHVNEGEVEWPPSPWRILRALLATGFSKLGWSTVPHEARDLMAQLAAIPPSYYLPPGEVAHSRHYMPVIEGKKQTTTKVIDAFVRLRSDEELLIHFPAQLDQEQLGLLQTLVEALSYLGRAESWVDARLVEEHAPDQEWCQASMRGEIATLETEPVPVLAPVSEDDYHQWRTAAADRAQSEALHRLEEATRKKGKSPSKSQVAKASEKALKPFPIDWLACLLQETADLQQHGWSWPPGSRQVLYYRPRGTLERRAPRPATHHRSAPPVDAALLALASDTVGGTLLPAFTRCLPQAELLHQSLVSRLGPDASQCSTLTGRDPLTGRALQGHQHAHYLPLDLDDDGQLDHVIVFAPMGLDGRAQSAIHQLSRTWTKGKAHDLIVTCVGLGNLIHLATQLQQRSGRHLGMLGTGTTWESVTPFVPPRFLKRNKHTLEDQIVAELQSRGFPVPVTIESMTRGEVLERKLLKFVRCRRAGKPQPPAPLAFGLRLVFDSPISGPIALGYAAHFGLGLFVVAK